MEKLIDVKGKKVLFKATGSTLRRYRQRFQRDLFVDMQSLMQDAQAGEMSAKSLEIFENIAYVMAKQGDSSIPDDPNEWLDEFEMMSIYEVLPQLIELMGLNEATLETEKKKQD